MDPASGPGVVTVSHARLSGDGSQGSAPFRRRKLWCNLGKLPLTGAQQVGYLSIRSPSVSAGGTLGVGVNFVPVLSKTPTGLSFSQIAATNVGSGPSVTSGTLTPYGCEVTVTASATGAVVWTGKYTTVGA